MKLLPLSSVVSLWLETDCSSLSCLQVRGQEQEVAGGEQEQEVAEGDRSIREESRSMRREAGVRSRMYERKYVMAGDMILIPTWTQGCMRCWVGCRGGEAPGHPSGTDRPGGHS